MKIAEKINKPCSGEAFVIGFMSDAGVPSLPGLVGEDYPGDDAAASHPTKLHAHERNTFQCTHVDVIMVLCRIWKLPERLSKPISQHHTRPSSCDPKDDYSLLNSLAYFAGNLPLSADGKVDQGTTSARDAERLFQIDSNRLQELLKEAGNDFEAFRTMFGDLVDASMSIDKILEDANAQITDEDNVQESGEATTVVAAGMSLSLAQHAPGSVPVNVSQAGETLVSEQITADQDEPSVRTALLIDDATAEEFHSVKSVIDKLAA